MATPGHHNQDVIIPHLLEEGIITEESLARAQALAHQDGTESTLYHIISMGIVRPDVIASMLGAHFRIEGVDLTGFVPEEKVLNKIDAVTAVTHRALPLKKEGNRYRIAMANPADQNAISDLMFALGTSIIPVIADTHTLAKKIDQCYNRTGEELQKALLSFGSDFQFSAVEDQMAEIKEQVDDAPIVRLIHATLIDGVKKRASDIHIEPVNSRDIRFRFRIDGELREIDRADIRMLNAIISRIKILAELNIAERQLPQDGRIKLKMGNKEVDFRVSIMPTSLGEKAVLRILDKSAVALDLETLGFDDRGLKILTQQLNNPYGMVIATGPTGSGKSTTLYSMLLRLDPEANNVLTAEDPIEYDLDGISQTAVRPDLGLDFANVLRAFLRQDPNTIMIGEMRDLDTAHTAVRAALTGHLVLSTLHTNDAASAFTRLIDMGVERFNVATALTTVVAQRLIRRICRNCKEEVTYTSEFLKVAGIDPEDVKGWTFYRGRGCAECEQSGYKGRTCLPEVLLVTKEVAEMVMMENISSSAIKTLAREQGMKTLREIGMERVRDGISTVEEVIRETVPDNII